LSPVPSRADIRPKITVHEFWLKAGGVIKLKHLDKVANLAIVVAVVVFLAVTAKREFYSNKVDVKPHHLIGTTVRLSNLNLAKDHDSILLVISSKCHFCQDSLPFYRELTQDPRRRMKVIALLPQAENEANRFLDGAGVKADQILTAGPDAVGAIGTPTVLIVDSSGRVRRSWIGKLDEKNQRDLMALAQKTSAS
jgi:hypothetical protein